MLPILERSILQIRSVSVWLAIMTMGSARNVLHAVINAKPAPTQLPACPVILRGKEIRLQLSAYARLDITIMVYHSARYAITAA